MMIACVSEQRVHSLCVFHFYFWISHSILTFLDSLAFISNCWHLLDSWNNKFLERYSFDSLFENFHPHLDNHPQVLRKSICSNESTAECSPELESVFLFNTFEPTYQMISSTPGLESLVLHRRRTVESSRKVLFEIDDVKNESWAIGLSELREELVELNGI